MYGEDNTKINKQIKIQEQFFKTWNYKCTCVPGYGVCKNCNIYYEWPFGKLSMVIAYYVGKAITKIRKRMAA